MPALFGITLKKLQKAPLPAKPQANTLVAQIADNSQSDGLKSTLLPVVNKADIRPEHRLIADSVLRALPKECRNNLKNFYVRYEKPKNRGLGGKTTIILDGTVPDDEFRALLVHECGHVIHSNMLGTATSNQSGFYDGKQPIYNDSPAVTFFQMSWDNESVFNKAATKDDFVSGYASSDPFEDFAETFALYILHRGAFEAQARENIAIEAKLRWMEDMFPVETMAAKSGYEWAGKEPWDVTKLAFEWKN